MSTELHPLASPATLPRIIGKETGCVALGTAGEVIREASYPWAQKALLQITYKECFSEALRHSRFLGMNYPTAACNDVAPCSLALWHDPLVMVSIYAQAGLHGKR